MHDSGIRRFQLPNVSPVFVTPSARHNGKTRSIVHASRLNLGVCAKVFINLQQKTRRARLHGARFYILYTF
jgi:hypothetical protein